MWRIIIRLAIGNSIKNDIKGQIDKLIFVETGVFDLRQKVIKLNLKCTELYSRVQEWHPNIECEG